MQPIAPLQLYGVSESIATLVWQVASKENVLDKVQDEIHQVRRCRKRLVAVRALTIVNSIQFAEAIKTLPELRRIASDPLFPPLVRKAIVESLLKDSSATEVTKKLFCK